MNVRGGMFKDSSVATNYEEIDFMTQRERPPTITIKFSKFSAARIRLRP